MTFNNSNNGVNMRSDEKRDNFAKTFLYEHLPFNSMDRNLFDSITKTVIGTEELTKAVDYHWQNIEPSMADIYVRMKRMHLSTNFYRYSRIYDLCYVLGINNIYDIGCECINQGLMLIRYSNLHYCGIECSKFWLNDYRILDRTEKNFYYPVTDQTPPPFCDGRIRYIKAKYPCELKIEPNNIGVALSSFCPEGEKEVNELVNAFVNDFDRILVNISSYENNIEYWRNADWKNMKIYPAGRGYLIFGTKHPEDIERMKVIYPYSDGRFTTGIMSFYEYNSPGKEEDAQDCGEFADWN